MYFKDDWYILNQAINFDFWHWMNPLIPDVYRPLGAEIFFWLLHYIGQDSIYFAYSFVFLIYAIGIFYLYKTLEVVFRDRNLIVLTTLFYTIHSVRLYQLAWLGAMPETIMATCIFISFYFWVRKKHLVALAFFSFALLSKEIVLSYPLLFFGYELYVWYKNKRVLSKKQILPLVWLLGICILFLILRFEAMQNIAKDAEYVVHFQVKLWFNNLMWYSLWGLGTPAYWSDMFPSIFGKPIARFWDYYQNPVILAYTRIWMAWIILIFILILRKLFWKKEWKKALSFAFVCLFWLGISLLPVLGIIHKWPIRLSIPLLGICIYWAYLLADIKKSIQILAVLLFVILSVFGWRMNWNISTYEHEILVARISKDFFEKSNFQLKTLCFYDQHDPITSKYYGVQKAKTSWHDQEFISYISKKRIEKTIYSESGIQGCPNESEKIDISNFFLDDNKLPI